MVNLFIPVDSNATHMNDKDFSMEEDFNLLTDIHPDMLAKYADFVTDHSVIDGITNDEDLLAVPPSAVFNPLISPNSKPDVREEESAMDTDDLDYATLSNITTNDTNYESLSSELGNILLKHKEPAGMDHPCSSAQSLKFSHHHYPEQPEAFSDLLQMCNSVDVKPTLDNMDTNKMISQYLRSNTSKSETNKISENETSETLSTIGHGSGGTVTILRRKHSGPNPQLTDPLAEFLAPIPGLPNRSNPSNTTNSSNSLASKLSDSNNTSYSNLEKLLLDDSITLHSNLSSNSAIQVGKPSSTTHSDDEDDFTYDYDKLL